MRNGFFLPVIIGLVVVIGLVGLLIFTVVNNLGSVSEKTLSLPSFDNASLINISQEVKDTLSSEKKMVDEIVETISNTTLSIINQQAEVTESIKLVLGDKYSLYFFSVYNNQFKILEYTILTEEGSITKLEKGRTITDTNAIVQLDAEVVSSLFAGWLDASEVGSWILSGKIKIQPLSDVAKVQKLIPVILSAISAAEKG